VTLFAYPNGKQATAAAKDKRKKRLSNRCHQEQLKYRNYLVIK
jgi:hypothetical protein